jgi:transmembrane sensor
MIKNIQHNIQGEMDETLNHKIIHHASEFKVPYVQSEDDALAMLKAKIATNVKPADDKVIRMSSAPKTTWVWTLSAVASVLILLGVWFFAFNKPVTEVMVAKGEHTEYTLPDGTTVSMNADSKLTFSKSKFENERSVAMQGEAFFQVKKGSKFTIKTPKADIQILGTSFNVLARENTFKVSCFTGKVRVSTPTEEVFITPNESAEIKDGKLVEYADESINATSTWRMGEYSFESSPLKLVFNEIERQYNVNFVLPDLNELFFTGSFTNKNLVDALDIVCIPMGLTYEIKSNSTIIIDKKNK